MLKSKNYYVLWTVAMCVASLHSKICKIVLWYECARIIWMDSLLQTILHLLPPRALNILFSVV